MYAGEVSFPLYLCHFIGLREYQRLWRDYVNPNTSLILLDNLVAGILMSLLVATIVHHVVEQPCVKVGSALVRYLRATVFVVKEPPPVLPQRTEKRQSQRFSQQIIPENLDEFVKRRSQRLSKVEFSQFHLPEDDESSTANDSIIVEGRDSTDNQQAMVTDDVPNELDNPHRTLSFLDHMRSRGSRLIPNSNLRQEIHPVSSPRRTNSLTSTFSNIIRKASTSSSLLSKNVSSLISDNPISRSSSVYSYQSNRSEDFLSETASNAMRPHSEPLEYFRLILVLTLIRTAKLLK
ncbi:hypothetical protein HK103_004764 [Boothiomyces macroporosus]|uniref:Uncharacterized protein n=1 Tax=Boothiomyces macroporosus TaxID=261099 RepID=A0AAD5UM47_9FUNG|nr:hypothetical protein HK103_004764 [Boothiomyces macroporosus]